MEKGVIVIDELPIEQQEALKQWLIGKTVPDIDGKTMCCYTHDYETFMKGGYRGIISKFFKGWITEFSEPRWNEEAKRLKEQKYQLVVFKIPNEKNHLIEEIEKLLQQNIK